MDFTDKQKEILDKNKHGLFVVKAAPGSGKTFTIAKKAIDIIETWDCNGGLALLSFTNIAVDEIKETFKLFDNSFEIHHPHFIGTLDSFINNYIFLPFGHLEMKSNCRPKLIGKPFNNWVAKYYSQQQFTEITRNLDGDWIKVPGSKLEKNWKSNSRLITEKEKLIKKGYANRADAHYYALKILENHENILNLLIKRFPYIILDEAQDTSDVQMKILDKLTENGLKNLILVGDPEQAIYEWNNANPMLFENKYQEWKTNSIKLNENFRCSSSICEFISKFSHNNFVSKNKNNPLEIKPQFKTYTCEQDIEKIIIKFKQYCDFRGIPQNDNSRAILFRGQNFANHFKNDGLYSIFQIFKGNTLEYTFTRFVVLGKYLWDLGHVKEGFELLEKAYLSKSGNFVSKELINSSIEEKGLLKYRHDILKFIHELPMVKPTDNINDWINLVNSNLDLGIKLKNISDTKFQGLFKNIQLNLEHSNKDSHYGTIHSVKGKSFRAVLLILKEKPPNAKKYSKLFEQYNLLKEEELRIPYVAMTRAKEILWIMIPKSEKKSWVRKSESNPQSISTQQTLF